MNKDNCNFTKLLLLIIDVLIHHKYKVKNNINLKTMNIILTN